MSYDQLTKAQQDTLLADFMEGKTTICEAGHVDGLERIIADLREEIRGWEAGDRSAIPTGIQRRDRMIADLREENKRLRAELADIPYRAVVTK